MPSLKRILTLLQKTYGPRPWQYWGRAIPVLVETILSQNTSNANSAAGYRQLWREFRSWNKVANAPVEQVERCIRVSGLSNIKAPRIQQIRTDHGKIDLEFLKDYSPQDAHTHLCKFQDEPELSIDVGRISYGFNFKIKRKRCISKINSLKYER